MSDKCTLATPARPGVNLSTCQKDCGPPLKSDEESAGSDGDYGVARLQMVSCTSAQALNLSAAAVSKHKAGLLQVAGTIHNTTRPGTCGDAIGFACSLVLQQCNTPSQPAVDSRILVLKNDDVVVSPDDAMDTGGHHDAPQSVLSARWWDVEAANLTKFSKDPSTIAYEAHALVFTLQGLANRENPSLFFDLGVANRDYAESDKQWKAYLEAHRGVRFATIPPDLCSLVAAFNGTVRGD